MASMKSIWKGYIKFSLVTIPIKVYNGIETSESGIAFNQLHKGCGGRVGRKNYCKKCDAILDNINIEKGYEYNKDAYVVLSEEELNNAKVPSSRIIDIIGFVPINQIPLSAFESFYLIGPDGDIAKKTYGLLVYALKKTGKAGLTKISLRDRENIVIVSPIGDAELALYTLRYPKEIRNSKDIPDINDVEKISAKDAISKTACDLINNMSINYDQVNLKDEYTSSLKTIIDAKVAGKEMIVSDKEKSSIPPTINIMEVLQASIVNQKVKSKTK